MHPFSIKCKLTFLTQGSNYWQLCLRGRRFLSPASVSFHCQLSRVITHEFADDAVLPQDDEERKLYKLLSEVTGNPPLSLSSRWREPSLTIHSVTVSGPGSAFSLYLRYQTCE